MVKICAILFLFLKNLEVFNCARILSICPYPSYSHQLIHTVITKELSLRGHQVIQFTVNPLKDSRLRNLTEIDISFLYDYPAKADYENSYKLSRITILHLSEVGLRNIAEDVLKMPQMQEILSNQEEKFDLVMIESGANSVFSLFGERFKCPVVAVRSVALRLQNHDSLGNPTNPAYISMGYYENIEHSFWKKVDSFLCGIVYRIYHYFFTLAMAQELSEKYLPGLQMKVLDAEKNISLVLANTSPVLIGVRPLVPSLIEVPGIHIPKEKTNYSWELKKYLDDSKSGVVFVSLGTTANGTRVDTSFIDVLNHTFRHLPYDVIWKWNGPSQYLSKNVKILKWASQVALLEHPKTKLFITHAGYLSFLETVYKQVPVIAVPLFADQYKNSQRIEKLGIGLAVEYSTITKTDFLNKCLEVIKNTTYKRNIVRVSNIVKDQQVEPLEKAMWWVDYVLRHRGTPYYRSDAVDLNWIEYLALDLIVFTAMCISIFAIFVKFTIGTIIYLFNVKRKPSNDIKKKQ